MYMYKDCNFYNLLKINSWYFTKKTISKTTVMCTHTQRLKRLKFQKLMKITLILNTYEFTKSWWSTSVGIFKKKSLSSKKFQLVSYIVDNCFFAMVKIL
jgi:hypothetical protein